MAIKKLADEVLDSPLRNSIHPVFFESNYEDCKYWGHGTLFLFTYKREQYVITAKHVIANQMIGKLDPTDLRVVLPGTRSFVRLTSWLHYGFADGQDEFDLIVFKVCNKSLEEISEGVLYLLDITELRCQFDFDLLSCEFLAIGYPGEERSYDDFTITSCLTTMKLRGMTTGAGPGLITTEIVSDEGLTSIDGMSGSPVMCFDLNKQELFFAGMLVRGTIQSRKAHFIDSRYIYAALDSYSVKLINK